MSHGASKTFHAGEDLPVKAFPKDGDGVAITTGTCVLELLFSTPVVIPLAHFAAGEWRGMIPKASTAGMASRSNVVAQYRLVTTTPGGLVSVQARGPLTLMPGR